MTLMEHNLAALVTTSLAHRVQVRWTAMRHASKPIERVQVRWTAMRHASKPIERTGAFVRATAVLVLEMVDDDRAMMELWIEEHGRRSTVRERSAIRVKLTVTGDLLQIDAEGVCRLTLRNGSGDSRPLFAQCSLLESEGFHGGRFDPPVASVKTD